MPLIAALVFAFLVVAVLLGRALGQRLAERHLTAETRDTIKLSLGFEPPSKTPSRERSRNRVARAAF